MRGEKEWKGEKKARMTRVYICSPFKGDVNQNVLYARACMRHSLLKGEAPFPPHLLYTQPEVLNDSVEEERKIAMRAGRAFLAGTFFETQVQGKEYQGCEVVAVYYDRGISKGMMQDMEVAAQAGIPLDFRSLNRSGKDLWKPVGHQESQDRGITEMWLDESDRTEARDG